VVPRPRPTFPLTRTSKEVGRSGRKAGLSFQWDQDLRQATLSSSALGGCHALHEVTSGIRCRCARERFADQLRTERATCRAAAGASGWDSTRHGGAAAYIGSTFNDTGATNGARTSGCDSTAAGRNSAAVGSTKPASCDRSAVCAGRAAAACDCSAGGTRDASNERHRTTADDRSPTGAGGTAVRRDDATTCTTTAADLVGRAQPCGCAPRRKTSTTAAL
jgi:hypothetical protein